MADFFLGIVIFPFWWYTRGLMGAAAASKNSIANASAMMGLGVWVKNLFVPMYGETSIFGRVVSFGVRLFMIVFRGIGVGIWTMVVAILFLIYVSVLPLSVIGILFHGIGLIVP